MDRFSPETIHGLAVMALLATVFAYFFVAAKHRRASEGGPEGFLRYRTRRARSGISSDLLRATLMASAFSLASAIYVYVDWASTDGMFVLWSPITWALGALVLYLLRRRIYAASRDTWTLHGFLGNAYASSGLTKLASLVTSTVFLLQVVAEVYVGVAVLHVFVGERLPLWGLAALVGAVFIGYSMIGGLPSVLLTDRFQYKVTAFALAVAAIMLFTDGGYTAVERVFESLQHSFLPSGALWIVLASLLALNLPLFVTDMSVWQRVGAAESERDVTKGLGSFVPMLLGWMSLLVVIGTGFAIFFEPAEGMTASQMMIGYFSDSMVFPLLLVGFLAALLSTGDTFLIASVQTLLADWKYARRLAQVDYEAERLPAETSKQMLTEARFGILVLGTLSVVLGYVFYAKLPSLLDLLFVVFGLQTALAAPVLWGLFDKARATDAASALASLVLGGITALVCLILALQGVELMGVTLGLWAPILVLVLSAAVFFGGRALGIGRSQIGSWE